MLTAISLSFAGVADPEGNGAVETVSPEEATEEPTEQPAENSETTAPDANANVDKFCKIGRYFYKEAECKRRNVTADHCLSSKCGYAICGQHGSNCANLAGSGNSGGSDDEDERGPCGKGIYVAPAVSGKIRSGFGWRKDPFTGKSRRHEGWDYSRPKGTEVKASAGGKVVSCGWLGGYGKAVEIEHVRGFVTRYAHLHKIKVNCGQRVSQGDIIGTINSTGRSTGNHLHYEVICNGNQVNPSDYVGIHPIIENVPLPRRRPDPEELDDAQGEPMESEI